MSIKWMERVFRLPGAGMTARERLVLLSLADKANDAGECWPRQKRLARDAGTSIPRVSQALARLAKKGMIAMSSRALGKQRTGRQYRLTFGPHDLPDEQVDDLPIQQVDDLPIQQQRLAHRASHDLPIQQVGTYVRQPSDEPSDVRTRRQVPRVLESLELAGQLIDEDRRLTDLVKRPEQRTAFMNTAAGVFRKHGEAVLRNALARVAEEHVTKRGSRRHIRRPSAYLLRIVENLVAGA